MTNIKVALDRLDLLLGSDHTCFREMAERLQNTYDFVRVINLKSMPMQPSNRANTSSILDYSKDIALWAECRDLFNNKSLLLDEARAMAFSKISSCLFRDYQLSVNTLKAKHKTNLYRLCESRAVLTTQPIVAFAALLTDFLEAIKD